MVTQVTLLTLTLCIFNLFVFAVGSNGTLCITELETVLQLGTSENMSALSCRVIHRLHPMHTERNKDKVISFFH